MRGLLCAKCKMQKRNASCRSLGRCYDLVSGVKASFVLIIYDLGSQVYFEIKHEIIANTSLILRPFKSYSFDLRLILVSTAAGLLVVFCNKDIVGNPLVGFNRFTNPIYDCLLIIIGISNVYCTTSVSRAPRDETPTTYLDV